MVGKVLIVGAGPIGLLLATSLRQHSVDVTIIDKAEGRVLNFSKALSMTSVSLKAFHGMDLVDCFLNRGKKLKRAEIFFTQKRACYIDKTYLNSLYNFYLSIPQYETEQILESALREYKTQVQYHQELADISQSEKCVQVAIKDLKTNQRKTGYFDFVIGCDGAHSKVRSLLNIPFVGEDYKVHFILGDVRFHSKFSPACPMYYIDNKGFIVLYPMDNGYTRIVVQKPGGTFDSIKQPTAEEIQPYLDDYLPYKLDVSDLVWSSRARIVNRMAQSMRDGRIFLAGDACHLFSPVGGQAMNTGFQDAVNLAWKLGHYLNGVAKSSLLETYNQDRLLAAKKVLFSTDLYTRLIMRDLTDPDKLARFQPSFKNRQYYRKDLPSQLAGYKADYSLDEKDLRGRHVPYVEFQENYFNLRSTYDLPQLKKHVLFTLDASISLFESEKLALYSKAVVQVEVKTMESTLIKSLRLSPQNVCMISPDGYIVIHGEVAQAIAYLNQYY